MLKKNLQNKNKQYNVQTFHCLKSSTRESNSINHLNNLTRKLLSFALVLYYYVHWNEENWISNKKQNYPQRTDASRPWIKRDQLKLHRIQTKSPKHLVTHPMKRLFPPNSIMFSHKAEYKLYWKRSHYVGNF